MGLELRTLPLKRLGKKGKREFQNICHGFFMTRPPLSSQVDEVMEVSAELANILRCSRFASEFTFQPPGAPSSPCCAKPQVAFIYVFKIKLYIL